MEGRIKRGDIWTVTPPKHPKSRPVVIVSINALNDAEWPDVVVIPITTVPGPLRAPIPERRDLTGLHKTSYAKCEALGPLEKVHLKERIGALPSGSWQPIKVNVLRVLGFDD